MFPNRARDRGRCVTLGTLVVALGNTKEAGWRAVAAPSLVSIVTGAVEMMEGILVGPTALTANDEVFVVAATVHCVAEA